MTADKGRLSRFTAVFAGGTLFSRVLGMVRDILWVRFVPGASLDAFIVAFRLPNMLRDVIGEGAMNAAFVPVFSDIRTTKPDEEFRALIRASMSAMLILLLILTVIGVLLIPGLLSGIDALNAITGGPPRAESNVALVVSLSRWTFPYLFFIGMAVFFMGPLFTLGHYATPGWSPALLNVALIASVLAFHFLWPEALPDPAWALVIGIWLGGVGQLAAQYIALGRLSGVWIPSLRLNHPGIRDIFLLMIPVIFGQAAGEVNKLVDTLFAYSLEPGTVTQLYCANRLIQLPLSLFGFATAAAVLPAVSSAFAKGAIEEARAHLVAGLRQTFFLVLPAALGLIVLGNPILRLLFEHGEFVAEDTQRAAQAMAILAVGLVAFALVKVVVTGFYGMKNTTTPVVVSSCAMVLNIVLNFALVKPLGFRGLVIATTLAFAVNFAALYIMLWRKLGPLWDSNLLTTLIRVMVAGCFAVALGFGAHVLCSGLVGTNIFDELVSVFAAVFSAAAAYTLLCLFFDVEEVRPALNIIRRKLRRG